jgi:short subunit dehydrogenase-like uncharacterized protein
MTTNEQIQKQNEAACTSVALHERHSPTPWEHRPEIKTRYDSQTGAKSEEVQNWIYSKDEFIALASKETGAENAAFIVRAVNTHKELIEQVESLSEFIQLMTEANNAITPNSGGLNKNDGDSKGAFNLLLSSAALLKRAKAAL